ncbi:MAG: NADH-quinone oxidoreductase subunit C [Acidimicrobiales bacterium]
MSGAAVPPGAWTSLGDLAGFADRVWTRVEDGARFCGLFATPTPTGTRLLAVVSHGGGLGTERAEVPSAHVRYPSLTPRIAAAGWYEQEIHDLFGLEAVGHGRLDPLVLPVAPGSPRPRPGSGEPVGPVELDTGPLPSHLRGEGVFTIPYGPVRSGVFESVEYLVETPGEDIPHVRARMFHKHRGIEVRFQGMTPSDGVLLAERCEGVASVAHAVAYCSAVEAIAGAEISDAAGLVRVLHAELERIANHLDSVVRHAEAAGQAVAYARLTFHKERVQRLRSQLCGSRFGRGVVVPGGVSGRPALEGDAALAAVDVIDRELRDDLRLLMATPSFIDRLRTTGVIPPDVARPFGALGPVGRGSGQMDDARIDRPYAAYGQLGLGLLDVRVEGDALARQNVRLEEISAAFHLVRQAIDRLGSAPAGDSPWAVPIDPGIDGEAIGWAEAPQGEVLYTVAVEGGRMTRVKPRSASFHNLGLFQLAFPKDVLTDFAFIEASFGLSIAGVAG